MKIDLRKLLKNALRLLSWPQKTKLKALPDLPTFNSGGHLVDIADRNALYEAMEDQMNELYVSKRSDVNS
jgi:hypothetical protein